MQVRLILLLASGAMACGGERQTPTPTVASSEVEAVEPAEVRAEPQPVDPAIAAFVRTLDEDPDMLHNDYTPSVHGLIAAGVPGALAVVDLLRSTNAETRLHARRVVEGVALKSFGWQAGQGFPAVGDGETRSRALLSELGFGDDPSAAVDPAPARRWLEDHLGIPHDVSRVLGPIDGYFHPERRRVVAGEPIWVEFVVRNKGAAPLEFHVGGDYRGALQHTSFNWIVRDASGAAVCDQAETPPMIFGGLGTDESLAEGEVHRERHFINPNCEALLQPGTYRITGVRALTTHAQQTTYPSGCDTMPPRDATATTETDVGTSNLPPACVSAFRALPHVATDFTLEILPFDPRHVAARIRAEGAQELSYDGSLGNRIWYAQWVCQRLKCDCIPLDADHTRPLGGMQHWIPTVADNFPATLRAGDCPRE